MRTIICFLALIPLLAAGPAVAQTELGVDGGIIVEDRDGPADNLTTVALPVQQVRFAFWSSETVAVEFQTSLVRQASGGDSATQLGVEGGLRYRLGEWDGETLVPFLRGGAGLIYRNFQESDMQLAIALGGGADVPLTEPLALRLEGRFERRFESDFVAASNRFAALIGLTVTLGD